jgi:hypothetical protein
MSILSQVRHTLFGPKTVHLNKLTNPCPMCGNGNCDLEVHLDSDGIAEMLVCKCPTCGPFKELYAGYRNRPQPKYERAFWQWRTGKDKNQIIPQKWE